MAFLTVYFEGTSNPLWQHISQIGLFSDMTDAYDLKSGNRDFDHSEKQFKIAFDGCGVTNGTSLPDSFGIFLFNDFK